MDSYLPGKNELEISTSVIQRHIENLHDVFIDNLVHYFNARYHVSAVSIHVMSKLLPEKPKQGRDNIEERKAYKERLRSLSLSASQIVEEIFAQFDGRGLSEQALYELKKGCHDAAWNSCRRVSRYERKKCVIRFIEYACRYGSYGDRWELSNPMEDILRGLSHYETGGFSVIPHEIGKLLDASYLYSDFIEFTDCKTITQMRLYKNGRVDIRFADESLAKSFEETYLGTVY